ncbi:General transcription factor IIF subunit 1 [Trichinella pseudospiralis]|uniref:Transcription initiation factor IIF subunit alpha n=1 Tax=Trichinella pseudospiralis TaxID=6337 RepID=A0A0V1FKI7_TRIPS|nr:General transcription factor IIF subunit 1 [Trichinella pseudospiralis]
MNMSNNLSEYSEYVVRVPKTDPSSKCVIYKFNGINLDPAQITSITVEREESVKQVEADEAQNSGIGKEAGQKVRRKKFGVKPETSKEELPLRLAVEVNGKIRHYRGIREGAISNYSDYWIFEKNGENAFDAYPVGEIYNLVPIPDRKAMSIEEVEEHFKRREVVLNQFALRARIRRPGEGDEDECEGALSKTNNKDQQQCKSLKLINFLFFTLMLIYFALILSTTFDLLSRFFSDFYLILAKANKMSVKKVHKTKTAGKRNEHEEGAVMEESDDGDEDGREVDYMSDGDSSSSVELEEKTLIGIDEELTDAFQSVDESEQEQDDENAESDKEGGPMKLDMSKKTFATTASFGMQAERETESSSGSEDPDSEDINSPFLLQCKTDAEPVSTKRKFEEDSSDEEKQKKNAKLADAGTTGDGTKFRIMEEEVRHCLQRHPMSTTDLVAKFKPRCKKMNKQQIVSQLANILKKLKPEQTRRKGTLYFSLRRT